MTNGNKKYWLLKSEPGTWSWDMQVAAGSKGTAWTGVRNHVAKNNLKAMKRGDLAFFYHTGEEKQIVGIIEIVRESYPDPTAEKGEPWIVVDVKSVEKFKKPVTLAAVKSEPRLSKMSLVTSARLSVQPVTTDEWSLICKMATL